MSLYVVIAWKSILTAIFPVYFIMLIFAIPYYLRSRNENFASISYLLLVLIGFILGVLFYIYIMQDLFPLRYTYILIYPLMLLCVPGYFGLIKFIDKYLDEKFLSIKKKLPMLLLAVIFIICVSKALNPLSESVKITKVSEAVLQITRGLKFVLITNYEPYTFSYFMNPNLVIGNESLTDKDSLLRNEETFKKLKKKYNCQVLILLRTKDMDFENNFKFKEETGNPFEIVSIIDDKHRDYVILEYQ